jgi:hypothetical protein
VQVCVLSDFTCYSLIYILPETYCAQELATVPRAHNLIVPLLAPLARSHAPLRLYARHKAH